MTKDNTKAIIGLLKNELQSITAAKSRLENEINSLEGMKGRINIIIEELEATPGEGPAPLTISEVIDFFIDERCIIDPREWEDYNRLYDDFVLFKEEEAITTKVLKRAFFAELATRGHHRHPGPGLYIGEPDNSINGIYLRSRRPEIEATRKAQAAQERDPLEIVREIIQERGQADREEEERRFNAILAQAEEDPGEEAPEQKRGLFDFDNSQN